MPFQLHVMFIALKLISLVSNIPFVKPKHSILPKRKFVLPPPPLVVERFKRKRNNVSKLSSSKGKYQNVGSNNSGSIRSPLALGLAIRTLSTLRGSSSLKDLNREADEPVDLLKLNALKGIGSPGGSLKARLYKG